MGEAAETAALRIRHFGHLPSPEDFASKIEPSNVPAVFNGAVKNCRAASMWDPLNGGLDYLQERVGSATVEAMRSESAPVFYGDLRSHERVPLSFSTFITSCKFYLRNAGSTTSSFVAQEDTVVPPANSLGAPDQYYLAQVSIWNTENRERCPLEVLIEDIHRPIFLGTTKLESINLWMNGARSRSSAHYDPHHNLLCVIAGCKQVVLWPPSACRFLYPMPIYGEASNHSAVDMENPDLSIHLRAKYSKEYCQKVILHSGDALFIPEGWFHQVDSDKLTIGVNFWWKSNMMSNMLEHMDAYYLRRILNRLVDKEMIHMLHQSSIGSLEGRGNLKSSSELTQGYNELNSAEQRGSQGNKKKHGPALHQLKPLELHILHELLSLVHDTVADQDEATESTSLKDSSDGSSLLEKDRVASIFWTAEPLVIRKVLLAMVHHFPRTLEGLILHMLSPISAEVLIRKFDELDQQTTKEEQTEFYQLFFSVFDDQRAAMDAILDGKETFAFQAFERVLDQYLGVTRDMPKCLKGRCRTVHLPMDSST